MLSLNQSSKCGRQVHLHLGPDPDCVLVLRFLGMSLERVSNVRSQELHLLVGTILLNQLEYIVEVLTKSEPSFKDNSGKPRELCY